MPLHLLQNFDAIRLGIWKIEEPESWFRSKIEVDVPAYTLEQRRCQYLSSRLLFAELNINPSRVIKDEFDKPKDKENVFSFSISHCPKYAAIMISSKGSIGIDVEPIRDKVDKIKQKFLYPEEYETSNCEKLMVYWSAKESLYKLFGEKGLDFKTDMSITPFDLQEKGELTATINLPNFDKQTIKIWYEIFDNHVLTRAELK